MLAPTCVARGAFGFGIEWIASDHLIDGIQNFGRCARCSRLASSCAAGDQRDAPTALAVTCDAGGGAFGEVKGAAELSALIAEAGANGNFAGSLGSELCVERVREGAAGGEAAIGRNKHGLGRLHGAKANHKAERHACGHRAPLAHRPLGAAPCGKIDDWRLLSRGCLGEAF